ncbi:MAG: protein kinase, partial [Acidobacteriota bacterium]
MSHDPSKPADTKRPDAASPSAPDQTRRLFPADGDPPPPSAGGVPANTPAAPVSSEQPTLITRQVVAPPKKPVDGGATSHDHGETTVLPPTPAAPVTAAPPPVTAAPPPVTAPIAPATAAGAPVSGAPGNRGPFTVNALIADRYEVRKVLGVGGMGEVYRCHDRALGIDVALKVLRSEMAHDESFLQRFRNELLVARQVTHPNVVRIHDLGQHGHLMFMTMDLVEGRSLSQLMEEEGRLEKERAIAIIEQVAAALAASHERGVVHRDLKPANILLDADEKAYVTDFGIARSLHFSGLTRTGEVLGTPDYLAPEQARGEDVGPHTDLYALGLIFFEMVSGKRPYAGGTLVEVLAQHMGGRTRTFKELGVHIDPALEAVVARCLAPEPKDRYSSADELLADIADLTKPMRRAQLAQAKKLGTRFAAGAAAVAVAAAIGWWATHRPAPAPPPPPETDVAQPAPIAALPAVVLLPLANRTGDDQLGAWAEAGIPEELKGPLLDAGAVRVVQGRSVQRTLDDLGFTVGDLTDGDLQTLAEVLDARHLVTGSLLGLEDKLQMTVQLAAVDKDGVERRDVYEQLRPRGELLGSIADAAGAVRQALELPPAAPAATSAADIPEAARQAYYEGIAHRDAGRVDQALEALERATVASSGYAEAWLALADLLRGQGRFEESLEAADQAAAVAVPQSRIAFESRAAAAVASGRPDLAQAELRTLVERFPSDMEARLALARAHGDQGQL